jgi:hypothetical protein
LNEAIAIHHPVKLDTAVDGVRDHVVKSIVQFGEILKAQLVARDGIEPPTPAFSGLLTDNAKWFGISGSPW